MSKKKLTHWFPYDVKPVHTGVYETTNLILGGNCYQFWNGTFWGAWGGAPSIAEGNKLAISDNSAPAWRGLAVKP